MQSMSKRPSCRGWMLGVLGVACLTGTAAAGEVITIYPEADSLVDTLVPFPYQGTSTVLPVSYDPTISDTCRSYLRFPLSSMQGREGRIVGASLTVTADYVPNPCWVYVHRSANVTWPENGINFGNQPGFGAPVLVSKWVGTPLIGGQPVAHAFNLLAYSNWDVDADVAVGKVTFALRTDETGTGPYNVRFARFFSREGTVKPALALSTRLRGEVVNADFENGLDGYQLVGSVDVITDPREPSNHVARLRTASTASLSQVLDLPEGWFGLLCRTRFATPDGSLQIEFDGMPILQPPEPQGERDDGFGYTGRLLDSRKLPKMDDARMSFVFDGPAGTNCEMWLDDIGIFDVPDPVLEAHTGPNGDTLTLAFDTAPGTMNGFYYQLERSDDLAGWQPFGDAIVCFGGRFETTVPVVPNRGFFRLSGFLAEPFRPGTDNPSFEDPGLEDETRTSEVAFWETNGPAGSWNLPPTQYDGNAPDGDHVAYAGAGGTLVQRVMDYLMTEQRYFVEVRVGRRSDIDHPNLVPPDVYLRIDGQKLTPTVASSPTPAPGEFKLWQREYSIGAGHPLAGRPVELVLDGGTSDGSPCEVNFDTADIWSETEP